MEHEEQRDLAIIKMPLKVLFTLQNLDFVRIEHVQHLLASPNGQSMESEIFETRIKAQHKRGSVLDAGPVQELAAEVREPFSSFQICLVVHEDQHFPGVCLREWLESMGGRQDPCGFRPETDPLMSDRNAAEQAKAQGH